jgi:DNA modification methylase
MFASRGARRLRQLPLLDSPPEIKLNDEPLPPILSRISESRFFIKNGHEILSNLLLSHTQSSTTSIEPPNDGMSAGKNTYTYDAHTYHTKVPPQGIAELIKHYLPEGGLVLDPFSGSGMTGVAAISNGYDCILNELSPAACFISSRFSKNIDPVLFEAGVQRILEETIAIRKLLYTTNCRECGKEAELSYLVWSYKVLCPDCKHEFVLWDVCRHYGESVKEHKILSEFPCPKCKSILYKSRLQRTISVPVQVGYKCCGSRQQEVTHPPDERDLERILAFEIAPPVAEGFYPTTELPTGVNLRQPARHGIDRIDRFYTPRNLAAMSHIWRAIHRVEDSELAAQLAFVVTSLYQRVTRLSEFRFWGGSGNTARFNVPYISNESNVFVTFARKARSIQDHLETTATHYSGTGLVVQNSATNLDYLPDRSVDLIFTDPPFGAYINYSEMNILWESWLQRFTDNTEEAIINRVQQKGVVEYKSLMAKSLNESYRVLRPGHWLLLVFMNNSGEVWEALHSSITSAGFCIVKADIFDKQHGTFKQFVSENTAGCDLVLHCLKPEKPLSESVATDVFTELGAFLEEAQAHKLKVEYLHVERDSEIDMRQLYSAWIGRCVMEKQPIMDFARFRKEVEKWIAKRAV